VEISGKGGAKGLANMLSQANLKRPV